MFLQIIFCKKTFLIFPTNFNSLSNLFLECSPEWRCEHEFKNIKKPPFIPASFPPITSGPHPAEGLSSGRLVVFMSEYQHPADPSVIQDFTETWTGILMLCLFPTADLTDAGGRGGDIWSQVVTWDAGVDALKQQLLADALRAVLWRLDQVGLILSAAKTASLFYSSDLQLRALAGAASLFTFPFRPQSFHTLHEEFANRNWKTLSSFPWAAESSYNVCGRKRFLCVCG